MAAVEDVKALQKQVFDLARAGKLVGLTAVLEEHPEVDVDAHKDQSTAGGRGLFWACTNGHTECAQLLIEYKADVNAKDSQGSALHGAGYGGHMSCVQLLVQNGADVNSQANGGETSMMQSALMGYLPLTQYLLQHKADIHYRVSKEGVTKNMDALHYAMSKFATDNTPGVAFAFLSCNTDAKNVNTFSSVSAAVRDTHIETYKQVQAHIDEYFSILQPVLSDHVQVDTRVGRGNNGLYHEPLEQVLLYLGLSMSKDQVVNASIDGESVKRALMPGYPVNANLWFELCRQYKREHVTLANWGCVDPNKKNSDKKHKPRQHNKPNKKKNKKNKNKKK
jgi:hypothetical protein